MNEFEKWMEYEIGYAQAQYDVLGSEYRERVETLREVYQVWLKYTLPAKESAK